MAPTFNQERTVMTAMNKYARRAMDHWQTHLPAEYQAMPETTREPWFRNLGEQIEDAITAREQELADQQEPTEPAGFKNNYALLMTLRHQAEEQVLEEMLPAPAGQAQS
jgi:hypothetical protein